MLPSGTYRVILRQLLSLAGAGVSSAANEVRGRMARIYLDGGDPATAGYLAHGLLLAEPGNATAWEVYATVLAEYTSLDDVRGAFTNLNISGISVPPAVRSAVSSGLFRRYPGVALELPYRHNAPIG